MRKFIPGFVLLTIVFGMPSLYAQSASSSDDNSWTGFYIGVNAGRAWKKETTALTVVNDSPASRANLLTGDIVLRCDDKAIIDRADFQNWLRAVNRNCVDTLEIWAVEIRYKGHSRSIKRLLAEIQVSDATPVDLIIGINNFCQLACLPKINALCRIFAITQKENAVVFYREAVAVIKGNKVPSPRWNWRILVRDDTNSIADGGINTSFQETGAAAPKRYFSPAHYRVRRHTELRG